MLIAGGCHCGNVKLRLDWRPDPAEIAARACTCSFCVKHGGVWASCPEGNLDVRIAEPHRVSHYEFGTRTAQFHVCARCGVVPVVTSRIGGTLYAVVSVNALEGLPPGLVRRTAAAFEEGSVAERLERRRRDWVASVVLAAGAGVRT